MEPWTWMAEFSRWEWPSLLLIFAFTWCVHPALVVPASENGVFDTGFNGHAMQGHTRLVKFSAFQYGRMLLAYLGLSAFSDGFIKRARYAGVFGFDAGAVALMTR